eukprot:7223485-Lingulodinium_polyedra.AAC.1
MQVMTDKAPMRPPCKLAAARPRTTALRTVSQHAVRCNHNTERATQTPQADRGVASSATANDEPTCDGTCLLYTSDAADDM